MEDGLERSTIMYNIEKDIKYIYAFMPEPFSWKNCIIFSNKSTAIEYSKEKNCSIEIFIELDEGVYKPTNRQYINGKYIIPFL